MRRNRTTATQIFDMAVRPLRRIGHPLAYLTDSTWMDTLNLQDEINAATPRAGKSSAVRNRRAGVAHPPNAARRHWRTAICAAQLATARDSQREYLAMKADVPKKSDAGPQQKLALCASWSSILTAAWEIFGAFLPRRQARIRG